MASAGKRNDPYPKTNVPMNLKEILRSLGIKANDKDRVPWNTVPYALYDKGHYLAGLPTTMFYDTDHPSDDQKRQRLETYLQWPPVDPKTFFRLQQACSVEGLVRLLPRPDGSDIVFQTRSEDGTTVDIPRWKAVRPPRVVVPKPTQASDSNALTASSSRPPEPTHRKSSSLPGNATAQPQLGSKVLNTPASATRATWNEAGPSNSAPRPIVFPPSSSENPFSGSAGNLPLAVRQMLKSLGLQAGQRDTVAWSSLPNLLWTKGLYITGIPANVVFGSSDPSMDAIDNAFKGSLTPHWNDSTKSAMRKASERGDIKVFHRPSGRDVILEIITKHGPVDLVRWKAQPEPTVVVQPPPPSLNDGESHRPVTPVMPHRVRSASTRMPLIEGRDDAKPRSTAKSKKGQEKDEVELFRHAKEVPLKLRMLFQQAGIEEDPNERGYVPWETIPKQLWDKGLYISGLPAEFVLGKKSLEAVRNSPWKPQRFFMQKAVVTYGLQKALNEGVVKIQKRTLDRDVVFEISDKMGMHFDIGKWEEGTTEPDEDDDMEDDTNEDERKKPSSSGQSWHAQVNALTDQLAEMLVEAGVKLAPHDTREGKYKIVWHTLPKLLHQAEVWLSGFPLELLPYSKLHKQLLGRWVVRWNGATLDKVTNLLDYEGIAVEKWDKATQTVVQAFSEEKEQYDFTWDDFVNAEKDDPEVVAQNGVITTLVKESTPRRRRRKIDSSDEEDDAMQYDSPAPLSALVKRKASPILDQRITKRAKVDALDVEMANTDVDSFRDRFRSQQDDTGTDVETLLGGMSLEPDPMRFAVHESGETFRSMNRKLRRRKESIKSLVAILLYHHIPCVYMKDGYPSYFLPWRHLPRHLAARGYYLTGFPDVCAPVVDNDTVFIQSGPRYWDDAQWEALEKAIKEDRIDALPATRKVMFELVKEDGTSVMSNLGYSKSWLQSHFETEAGSSTSIYAWDPNIMDPVLMETELEWGPEDLP